MEHVAFQYRKEIEKMLGAALPPEPTEEGEHILPPQIEAQLSQLAAQAGAKLLQKDVAEAQAQQAAQQAQDPLLQLQKMDMQIKAMEAERKKTKDLIDAATKADELRLREKEITGNQQIAGAKVGIDVAKTQQKSSQDKFLEGARAGMELRKDAQRIGAEMEKQDKQLESQERIADKQMQQERLAEKQAQQEPKKSEE